MAIYIFNLVSVLIYTIILLVPKKVFNKKYNDNFNFLIIIITIQLFFISAFRSVNVGTDLKRYIPRYKMIAETDFSHIFELRHTVDFEYGYILYNKVISIFSSNAQVLLIVTSIIIIFSFSYFIKKYSKIPWLSFYLFITLGFFGGSFNILRQYLAMSILLYSIKYIKERNLFKFLLCLVLATSIHTTAAAFVILYPLYNIKVNNEYITVLTCVLIILGLTSEFIIKLVLDGTQYSKYLYEIGNGLGNGSGGGMLMILITVFICMQLFKDSLKRVDAKYVNLWLHMIIIAIIFNILALQLGIFERVMRYFIISMIIIIPNTIYSLKQKWLKSIGVIFVLLLTTFYYFKIIMLSYSSSGGIIPYTFMWQ